MNIFLLISNHTENSSETFIVVNLDQKHINVYIFLKTDNKYLLYNNKHMIISDSQWNGNI